MKKYYIKPSIATMEIETTSIMAGSTGINGDGSQGGIDNPKPGDGSTIKTCVVAHLLRLVGV